MDYSSLETVLQTIATGIIVGTNYGLMCLGLGMIFGVMRVINFAQGEFLTMGMYFCLVVVTALASRQPAGYAWIIATAALAVPVFYLVGVAIDRLALARVTGANVLNAEDGGHSPQLILTLGLSLMLQSAGLMLFGSTPNSVRTAQSTSALHLGPLWGDEIYLFLNQARLFSAIIAVMVALALAVFIRRTRWGRELRAAAANPVAATYLGIDVARQYMRAFGIGVALTAVAGVLMATYQPFQPYTGQDFTVIMYAGVVLGGMGSIGGAFWGGLILGWLQQMSTLFIPLQLQTTSIFVAFILILILRPQGLFGKVTERA